MCRLVKKKAVIYRVFKNSLNLSITDRIDEEDACAEDKLLQRLCKEILFDFLIRENAAPETLQSNDGIKSTRCSI